MASNVLYAAHAAWPIAAAELKWQTEMLLELLRK
jgi:hypothetical protein